jgi:hypothetical protein
MLQTLTFVCSVCKKGAFIVRWKLEIECLLSCAVRITINCFSLSLFVCEDNSLVFEEEKGWSPLRWFFRCSINIWMGNKYKIFMPRTRHVKESYSALLVTSLCTISLKVLMFIPTFFKCQSRCLSYLQNDFCLFDYSTFSKPWSGTFF